MAQQIRMLALRPDSLSSILRAHVAERENRSPQLLSTCVVASGGPQKKNKRKNKNFTNINNKLPSGISLSWCHTAVEGHVEAEGQEDRAHVPGRRGGRTNRQRQARKYPYLPWKKFLQEAQLSHASWNVQAGQRAWKSWGGRRGASFGFGVSLLASPVFQSVMG